MVQIWRIKTKGIVAALFPSLYAPKMNTRSLIFKQINPKLRFTEYERKKREA